MPMLSSRRKFFLPALLAMGCVLLISGCVTQDPNRARESSIPWNRPASWEGPGVLGAGMPQSR